MPAQATKFYLTKTAKASLLSIARYTEEHWGREQRNQYLKTIDATFHALANHPMQGIERPELRTGLRSFPEGKHIIYYLPETTQIIIVDILHEKMDPMRHIDV